MIRIFFMCTTMLFSFNNLVCQNSYKLASLKYSGGGAWYSNPSSLNNLIKFCNKNIGTNIIEEYDYVELKSSDIYGYPYVYATGHGNIKFTESEREVLRKYLLAGGFLHIDDNYGMDKFIRNELKLVFPNKELISLKRSHLIFNGKYDFSDGLPKIHQHDGKDAEAYAIYNEKRMIILYTYESDLGDGWEDQEVHNNSEKTREKALKMGANILDFVFTKNN